MLTASRAARLAFVIAACSLGPIPSFPAQECWRFLVSQSVLGPAEARAGSSSRPESRGSDVEVFLLPGSFILRPASGDRALVAYDFETRRIRSYPKPGAPASDDRSMMAEVSFRAYEIRNRGVLGGILEKAGAKDSPLDLLDAEIELGVELPDKRRKVTSRTEGDVTVYEADGRILARCHFGAHPVPAAVEPRLVSFLAWRCMLHPGVRRAIAEKKLMPRRIESIAKGPVDREPKTTVIRFEAIGKAVPPAIPAPPSQMPDSAVQELMSAILGKKVTKARVTPGELAAFATKASGEGKHLDAILALLSIGWIDQVQFPAAQFRECVAAAKGDPDVKTYFEALRAKEASETRRLVQSIPRQGLTHAYVLDVNAAATYHTERKSKEGIVLYKKALEAQPWMTGPWKDLGDLLGFDPTGGGAWRCYDIARAVCPTHPMLEQIGDTAERLSTAHPDFF
jgi:hypothetical protein